MNTREILNKTENFVKQSMKGDSSGHDWWHIHRVRNIAINIAIKENADVFIVELAALLHDISDWKFSDEKENKEQSKVKIWLEQMKVQLNFISHICEIINDLSFKGAGVSSNMKTLEGKIVQDADRLDAIGAIGIARTFAYGGSKGREIYNPEIKPVFHATSEDYKKTTAPTLNHFFEKLLLLKDLMNTKTAKQMANERHLFMEQFLTIFFMETELKYSDYKIQ